jgi:predicted nucleic acid-binding protein
MKRYALDTNCFIDAFNSTSHAYQPMQRILKAFYSKTILLVVSRHTLSEITKSKEAFNFAKSVEILPHYPIGTWKEQVATWNQISGTFGDAKRNQKLQEELKALAKSGNDIRDRGAYIDAINAEAYAFVTSDGQFANSSPAQRIQDRFGLQVIIPKQLAEELSKPEKSN